MHKEFLSYQEGNVDFEGFLAYEKSSEPKPLVLVAPDWSGRNEFACVYAEKLAELGYIGFAIDMFGQGKVGKTTEEKQQLMQPLINDRQLLRRRISAAFDKAKTISMVDSTKIAAIGFCFGGLCVLDLARSGAKISGVVSFHGLLFGANLPAEKIHAKVLALHGFNDPMVQPDQVLAFEEEMTTANVDWQLYTFGNTMHAFTNPMANDPDLGTVYNPVAERRAIIAMKNFLQEIFA